MKEEEKQEMDEKWGRIRKNIREIRIKKIKKRKNNEKEKEVENREERL